MGSPTLTGGGPKSQPVGLSEAHSESIVQDLVHMRSPVARLRKQAVLLIAQSALLRQGSQMLPVPTQAPNLCRQKRPLVPSESVLSAHERNVPWTPPQSYIDRQVLVQ